MIFKRNKHIPTLVNIYRKDYNPFMIELNTFASSSIYSKNNKYYIDVKVNDNFTEMFQNILQDCEKYMNRYFEKLHYHSNCVGFYNILKVKIVRKNKIFQLKLENNVTKNIMTVFDIKPDMKIKIMLNLEYIWMNSVCWGLTWKTNQISLITT